MQKAPTFDRVVSALNDAPLEGDWSRALELMANMVGGWSGSIVSCSPHKGILAHVSSGISDDQVREGVERGGVDPYKNPRFQAFSASIPMQTVSEANFTNAGEWHASEFYRNFAARIDANYSLFAKLDSYYDEITGLFIWRSAAQGSASAQEAAIFSQLLPNIRHALGVQREFDRRSLKVATQAWDRSHVAAFYCDAHLKVFSMSAAAEDAARAGRILQLKRGRLNLVDPRAHRRLGSAVAAACNRVIDGQSEYKLEATGVQPGDSAQFVVAPVNREASGALYSAAALVLLFTECEDAQSSRMEHSIHLTKAEKDIGRLLLKGYTTRQIADERRSSLSTVQTQIKSMNQKLNVSHRAQLLVKLRVIVAED